MLTVNDKTSKIVLGVLFTALLTMNGYLIYRSFAPNQPYIIPGGSSASQMEGARQKIIFVSGTGVAAAKPDIAVIRLGVKTQAETAGQAQSENALAMNNVLEALKKIGVTDSDIETFRYTLTPVTIYPDRDGKPEIVGYICQNNIAVTVNDVSRAGVIVDIAVEAGANEVDSIQFSISSEKFRELYEEALENALKDAGEKADVISRELKVSLVGPVEISVGPSYEPVPQRFESTVKGGTTIMPGELEVTVNVQVSYQYQ